MTTSKRILIYPYSMKSASAKLLKAALGAQFILKEGSKYVPKESDLVINWGAGYVPYYPVGKLVNNQFAVSKAVNKMRTFTALRVAGVATVPWTTDPSIASGWFAGGDKVVVRHTTTSSGGQDIEILTPPVAALEAPPAVASILSQWGSWLMLKPSVASNLAPTEPIQVPSAPLYTKYIAKEAEFRVHVGGGVAIHTQMKLRKNGVDPKEVWNHDNGYTFTSQCAGRISDSILQHVQALGESAIAALGLDFGAVDIAYAMGSGYVLEVNTAPGIEEPTLSKYVNYFRGIHVG